MAYVEHNESGFLVTSLTPTGSAGWVYKWNFILTADSFAAVESDLENLYAAIAALPTSGEINTLLENYVPTSRTISTAAPLQGGGALNGNLTLSIAPATTSAAGSMSAADKTKLDNAATANTPSTLVIRDASGNFSAGTITASLSGNATTATTAANLSGSITLSQVSGAGTMAAQPADDYYTAGQLDLQFTNIAADIAGKADNAHLHSIGDTNGLQDALDAKAEYPSQAGNSGKYLTTNGTTVSWGTVSLTLTVLAADPSSPVAGQVYFNSGDSHFYGYNGTAWVQLDN